MDSWVRIFTPAGEQQLAGLDHKKPNHGAGAYVSIVSPSGCFRILPSTNVLNSIKAVPEVCGIYCATANPVEVILAVTELGRGILGVIDGAPPKGVEVEQDIGLRKALLRQFGYKL